MRSILLAITLLTLIIRVNAQSADQPTPPSDTLTARVAPYPGQSGHVLKGSTHDLSLLDIRTLSLQSAISLSGRPDTADELLVVKDGDLRLTIADSTTLLGPGSVALVPAGISYSIEAEQATWYRLRFQSRHPIIPPSGGGNNTPFIMTWLNMPVQQTAKGETRQIFSRPTVWLSKIDLHATTLNPGEVSHPPHIHRSEEIILMRSGHVQLYIDGQHHPAAGGDLVFLSSGIPHALENTGKDRCEYFALQWQP